MQDALLGRKNGSIFIVYKVNRSVDMRRGQVRIIGGQWRGRKLTIPDEAGVRPTPDRVRETLFNWLAALIPGAVCLDLFAGSGALGLEALSRGAAFVVFVDQSFSVTQRLKAQLEIFKTTDAQVLQAKLPQQWPPFPKVFDIVFLDPPYHDKLLLSACFTLEEKGLLADPAYLYLESGEVLQEKQLPPNWTILKHQKAGQVEYYLVKRRGASDVKASD